MPELCGCLGPCSNDPVQELTLGSWQEESELRSMIILWSVEGSRGAAAFMRSFISLTSSSGSRSMTSFTTLNGYCKLFPTPDAGWTNLGLRGAIKSSKCAWKLSWSSMAMVSVPEIRKESRQLNLEAHKFLIACCNSCGLESLTDIVRVSLTGWWAIK